LLRAAFSREKSAEQRIRLLKCWFALFGGFGEILELGAPISFSVLEFYLDPPNVEDGVVLLLENSDHGSLVAHDFVL